MYRSIKALTVLAAVALVSACGGGGGNSTADGAPVSGTVATIINTSPNTTKMASVVNASSAVPAMAGAQPHTVLVPTDSASSSASPSSPKSGRSQSPTRVVARQKSLSRTSMPAMASCT